MYVFLKLMKTPMFSRLSVALKNMVTRFRLSKRVDTDVSLALTLKMILRTANEGSLSEGPGVRLISQKWSFVAMTEYLLRFERISFVSLWLITKEF